MNAYNRVNFLFFVLGLIISALIVIALSLPIFGINIPFYIPVVPLAIVNLVHLARIIPFLYFEGPVRRKDPFKEGDWNQVVTTIPGKSVRGLSSYFAPQSIQNQVSTTVNSYVIDNGPDSPIVMILHGWESSPHASSKRAQQFLADGWTVVLFEMRGHCSNTWNGLWNGERIRKDVEASIIDVENYLGRKVSDQRTVFYGHSFGGFVGIRILDTNSQGFSDLILESPMTVYSEIFKEISKRNILLKLFKPITKNRIVKVWGRLHPNSKVNSISDTDVPNWGFPTIPTLLVQSENDNRLGRAHYDAYINCIEDKENNRFLEYHLLDSLNHSGHGINATRDATIKMWLNREDESLLLD